MRTPTDPLHADFRYKAPARRRRSPVPLFPLIATLVVWLSRPDVPLPITNAAPVNLYVEKEFWVFSDDLRDVYRFARSVGRKCAGVFHAYEILNEPGWGYWIHDRYAAFLKTAYLELKDGDSDACALNASLGLGRTLLGRAIYGCGISQYSDVFNWYFYGPGNVRERKNRPVRQLLCPRFLRYASKVKVNAA